MNKLSTRQRKLFRIVMAAWLLPGTVTFDEWCAAFDKLYGGFDMKKLNKPILCLDFDGVIHSYASGWKGADVIPDPPVEGVMRFIWDASEHFTLAIFSSRSHQSGGKDAMKEWLGKHFREHWAADRTHAEDILAEIQWPDNKPAAFLSLDDRALCFNGTWPRPQALLAFKPWNKTSPDTALDVSFKLALLPFGDIGRLRLTKDGSEMIFTKEQAQSLANEIKRSLSDLGNLSQHAMNCRALVGDGFDPPDESDCTCGLLWKHILATEREQHAAWRKRAEESEAVSAKLSLEPTEQMITDGARRLLRFEDGSTDASFSALQWASAKNEAERVWRSMWLTATSK